MNPRDKIAKLVEQILLHKRKYYAGEPLISDAEYDKIEEELQKLAPEHPALSMIGAEASDSPKVSHNPPMLSLAKTYDTEELMSWVKQREVVGTLKLDGVALSLIYEKGSFALAKTRGNGTQGEDVSSKIRWLKECPFQLKESVSRVEIRGELYCSETQFAHLFKEMESLGLEKPSNPRNIVAGVLGRKQHGELARFFEFSAFEVLFSEAEEKKFHTEMEKFSWLKKQGFNTTEVELLKGKEAILSYLEKAKSFMSEGEVGIDGVVFSYNDLAFHEELGATSHHPRYKMSFKWQGETAQSTIEKFKWLTSRFGVVTPVAVIDPVVLSGAKITNVTLHNASFVEMYNLKMGDEIEIIRSGEVIPKFLKVTHPAKGHYQFPKTCPSCHGPLKYDEVRLHCLNADSCPAQQLHAILNWIFAADIDGLSIKRLEEIVKLKLIHHYSDLYTLGVEDFLKLPLTKDKMAKKLFESIQKTKQLPTVNFLTGLGISGVGKTSWEALLDVFHSVEGLQNATVEEIVAVEGFAEKTAGQIVSGLRAKKKDIEKLFSVGVHPTPYKKKAVTSKSALSGKTFVITGALSRSREEIEEAIERAGGKVVSAVSNKVSAVVTDDPHSSSSKAKKARELGIPFWSEEELNSKLN